MELLFVVVFSSPLAPKDPRQKVILKHTQKEVLQLAPNVLLVESTTTIERLEKELGKVVGDGSVFIFSEPSTCFAALGSPKDLKQQVSDYLNGQGSVRAVLGG